MMLRWENMKSMPSADRDGMADKTSGLTMLELLSSALSLKVSPLSILSYGEDGGLPHRSEDRYVSDLAKIWYKKIWNRMLEEGGMDFLEDCCNLREADIAEYMAGKDMPVSDFIDMVEPGVDLSGIFGFIHKNR